MNRAAVPALSVLVLFLVAAVRSFAAPLPLWLLVDSDSLNSAGMDRSSLVGASGAALARSHVFVAPSSLADVWPSASDAPECGSGLEDSIKALERDISDARNLFFRHMDTAAARTRLAGVLQKYFEAPCLGHLAPQIREPACRAAVLACRLELLSGRPESASAIAASLARVCSAAEIESEDVPPDAKVFIGGAIEDHRRMSGAVSATFVCGASCGGILVDGRPVSGTDARGPATIVLPAGRHVIEIPGSTSWSRSTVDLPAGRARVFVAVGFSASPIGDIALAVTGNLDAAAESLKAATGHSVAGIFAASPSFPDRTQAQASTAADLVLLRGPEEVDSGRLLATVSPVEGGLLFAAPPGSTLVFKDRSPWPWPWLAGGLAAAFLGSGVALNVMAERAGRTTESGVNSLSDYESYKAGAIAGYSLAGAGALAAVLLAVLRPKAPRRVLVVPEPAGFRLSF